MYRCLDEGDFDGAADYIKNKYGYEHPLEAKVRALGAVAAAPVPETDPEPEVEEAETVDGTIEETEEEPTEGVIAGGFEEPGDAPPEEPARSKPKRGRRSST